jgi:hypothetical protein
MALSALSYVRSIISSNGSLLLINHEGCGAPCGVAPFDLLPFSASPSIFVNNAVASPGEHVAAARGTMHLSF